MSCAGKRITFRFIYLYLIIFNIIEFTLLVSPGEMSYYRYIPSVYKSFWPGLNRTLRSSSVPRHVPALDYCQ